jgi:FkbM family methyltransferase
MILSARGTIAVLEPEKDRCISRWAERSGDLAGYDPRIRRILCPLIPIGGVVIDGGAYIGDHAVPFAERVGPTGEVWSFEVYLPALQCLFFNTERFPQVHVVPAALSDQRGAVTLRADHLIGSNTHVRETVGASEGIPSVTLDSFVFDRLDFIKLDLEGYELKALRGAEQTLRRHRPIVVAESGVQLERYGDSHEDLMAFMAALGYTAKQLPLLHEGGDVFDMLFRPAVT